MLVSPHHKVNTVVEHGFWNHCFRVVTHSAKKKRQPGSIELFTKMSCSLTYLFWWIARILNQPSGSSLGRYMRTRLLRNS